MAFIEKVTLKLKSKRKVPLKYPYLTASGSSAVKTVTDRHRHAAYHNRHW